MGTITGATRGNRGIAVANADLEGLTIQNSTVYGHYSHGIYINAAIKQFDIINNEVYDNNEGAGGTSGIYIIDGNQEFSVINNKIGRSDDTNSMAAGIVAGTSAGCTDFIIKNNIIKNCTDEIQTIIAANGLIKDNIPDYETLTNGATTLDITKSVALLDSSGGAITGTLGSGKYYGQTKTIIMTDQTTSSTVSITNHQTSDPEVATFNAVDETGVFMWTGTEWVTLFATCTFV